MKKILLTVAMLLTAAGMQAAAPFNVSGKGTVLLGDPIVKAGSAQDIRQQGQYPSSIYSKPGTTTMVHPKGNAPSTTSYGGAYHSMTHVPNAG